MGNKAVYLAGGFKSQWQQNVIKGASQFTYFDPSTHNLPDPKDFTDWDLNAIDNSDIIFAYMEEGNPGGYALALEIGYGKALNKLIILVEEHPCDRRDRHFSMVRECADYLTPSLEDGINILNSIQG